MIITQSILDFVRSVLEAIKEGFKSITIYKNTNGRRILSIGKVNIPMLTDKEIRTAFLLVIVVTIFAGSGAPLSEFKELEILLYNLLITSTSNQN